jgi:hypothetical protein
MYIYATKEWTFQITIPPTPSQLTPVMSKSTLILLSNLPRTSFLHKGLLRTPNETSTGNFSKIYMPVDK